MKHRTKVIMKDYKRFMNRWRHANGNSWYSAEEVENRVAAIRWIRDLAEEWGVEMELAPDDPTGP